MGDLEKLNRRHMEEVSKQMISAAQDLGITLVKGIPTQGMAYGSCFCDRGYVLAAALIADIEKVTLQSMEKGAVVGIVYLQLPSIPVGFYKLRIVKTAAQFIDKSGNVVAERPVVVKATNEPDSKGAGHLVITDHSIDPRDNSAMISGYWWGYKFVVIIWF